MAYYEKLENLPTNWEQNKFFMLLLNTKIALIEYKEERSSKQKMWLRLTALTLSTVVTIILGFKWVENTFLSQHQSNIALTVSGLVTLLAAIASFWGLKKPQNTEGGILKKQEDAFYDTINIFHF